MLKWLRKETPQDEINRLWKESQLNQVDIHVGEAPKSKQAQKLREWAGSWPPSIWSCGCAGLRARRPETRRWTLEVATARGFFEGLGRKLREGGVVVQKRRWGIPLDMFGPSWCAKDRAMRLLKVRTRFVTDQIGSAWNVLHGRAAGL
jgi:hypothetical protein